MKKLISILLTMVMILNLSVTAFAAENTSLTIEGADGSREYAGYQLLKLTTSLKTDNHTEHEGDHDSDCYNYSYTVNDTYLTVLQNEVFEQAEDDFWTTENPKPETAGEVDKDLILKYLEGQTSDEGEVYNSMRLVADRLYRAIVEAGIDADADGLTGENDNIEQGYWMIADVTDLEGYEANSLVMVDTKGQDALTIKPKTALPTLTKKVKDINNSTDDSIDDNDWEGSADHDIKDTVPFKLTATLPSNFSNYIVLDENGVSLNPYVMIFHDTLSEGLTLNANSIKIYMYDSAEAAEKDKALENPTADVTKSFIVTTEDLDDDECTFEVSCEDIIAIGGVTKDTVFVVYYEATLNENAVTGSKGNTNTAHLEFTNNPYGEGTGNTEDSEVVVFTYQLNVNKTDAEGNPLKGAGFTLYKKNANGEYLPVSEELVGEEMTTFNWNGLDDGDYKLSETTVPEGYNKMTDIEFSITAEHNDTDGLSTLKGGNMGTGVVDTGSIEKDIENNTGTILPETGAQGTFVMLSISAMLVFVAAVFMITRKKMSIYED